MPTPYQGNNEQIEQITGSLLKAARDSVGNPQLRGRALLEEIIRRTNGVVSVVDDPSLQEAEGGSLKITHEHSYHIFLSPFTSPLRDNFTLAHELGHYFLHYFLANPKPQSSPVWFTRYGAGLIESQANRFAASLLMPKQEFTDRFNHVSKNRYLVAGHFDVSVPAAEVRAQILGLQFE